MTTVTKPVHVVAGAAAGGGLRASGIPGQVVMIDDDLSIGPLEPPAARQDWFAAVVGPDRAGATHWNAGWDRLGPQADAHDEVVVWGGANPAEVVLVNAVCARLLGSGCHLRHLDVSGPGGPHYVAELSPEQLADLWHEGGRPIRSGERELRAGEYNRLARSTGVLRRYELGELVGVPVTYYDRWLLAACGPDWLPAARVVGGAMGRCDGHNKVGDSYLAWRLRSLAEVGRVEAEGPPRDLREWRVRRVPG